MEVNKDEAERCIEIGIAALKAGNIERAEKFVKKADNLYPTERAKELLATLNTFKSKPSASQSNDSTRRRRPEPQKEDVHNEPADYTSEQLEMVRRIKRCKDYYEVLNVTKESTDSEIKKAYKKLALQLHPDKNHAPGAVEAFKAVGNAVSVLTDAEKRKRYDLYGADGPKNMRREHHCDNHEYEHAYARGGFESDFTAEELFNMFFGGGFPQQRMNTHRRYQNQRNENGQQPSLAFGLILVLIVISMLSSFFTSDPVYSLSQTSRYPVRRNTIHLNIPYFVKDKFENDYTGSLARLENSVEEEYVAIMKQACYRERSYREVMIARAKNFGNNVHLEQAQNLKVPSCENLARIGLTKFLPY